MLTYDQAYQRHACYYLGLATEAERHLSGPDQLAWLIRLDRAYDNLRAALETYQTSQADGRNGLELVTAMQIFWDVRGYWSEGRKQLARALSHEGAFERTPLRAKALDAAGSLAHNQGDYSGARKLYEEALAIWRELKERGGVGTDLNNLGNVAASQGDYVAAKRLYNESLVIFREQNDRIRIAGPLSNLGIIAMYEGDYALAQMHQEESLEIHYSLQDGHRAADTLLNLGITLRAQGRYTQAGERLLESLALYRQLGDRHGVALARLSLGTVAQDQEDYASACALYEESLPDMEALGDQGSQAALLANLGEMHQIQGRTDLAGELCRHALELYRDLGSKQGIAELLGTCASLAAGRSEFARCAILWGAATALRREIHLLMSPHARATYDLEVARIRLELGAEAFASAWAQGEGLPQEQAIEYALNADWMR
ncbi:MAG TPA: tetratricopeptide repeat protein [Ktedonobacterales bacterium]|nr:tetratricopeptide repeat protein [Ktedonobacterales bacterium]